MFDGAQLKLKCWFQRLTMRPSDGRYETIDRSMDLIKSVEVNPSSLLFINNVKTERVIGQRAEDISKYSFESSTVYVKHVFIDKLTAKIKPTITAIDIDFFRGLDHTSMHCYVLVYVKNPLTYTYDSAFFLDDYEAIQGISKEEAECRLTDLSTIAKTIRHVLL